MPNLLAKPILLAVLLASTPALAQKKAAAPAEPPPGLEAQATYKDIQATFGLVPGFLKAYPPEAISGAWSEMKGVQLNPSTAISPKYKELIGLAVAAQVPCKYCVYFHTEAARLNGATDRELREAVALAASTRHWSTILQGAQTDEAGFQKELSLVMANFKARSQGTGGAGQGQPAATSTPRTPDEALKDIEATLGFVPTFMKKLPKEGLVGAWTDLKGLDLNPNTAIPGKYKSLISLAVAAQVPCRYCVEWDTKSLELEGASPQELSEAVAMAAITRRWSTVLNGNDLDEATFKREADQIIARARKSAPARTGTGGSGEPIQRK